MSLQRVFVVSGYTGEYSDHTEWTVAAYTTREMADLHCQLANEFVAGTNPDQFRNVEEKNAARLKQKEVKAQGNPYDPRMQMDYTGTVYGVEEILLCRHVDEFLENIEQVTK